MSALYKRLLFASNLIIMRQHITNIIKFMLITIVCEDVNYVNCVNNVSTNYVNNELMFTIYIN